MTSSSSFQVYESCSPSDLYYKLKTIDKVYIRQDVNLIRRLTKGYESMYTTINRKIYYKIKSNYKTKTNNNSYDEDDNTNITLENGWLDNDYNNGVGLTSKILNKRYELIKMIDRGMFSQIYEAKDLYTFRKPITNINTDDDNDNDNDVHIINDSLSNASNRSVVIKILRRGYHVLGIREHILLQHFSSFNNSSTSTSRSLLQNGSIQNSFCK